MEELDLKTLPSSYDREPHFPFTDENDGAEIKQEQLVLHIEFENFVNCSF